MDYCEICFDRPEPLACRGTGKIRIDACEGARRLLGELEVKGPVCLHYVEVEAHRKTWFTGERALCAVTVYNRSSLPLSSVVVSGGAAFLDGSVRVNGLPEPAEDIARGVALPGLDAGCQVVVTWEEELAEGTRLDESRTEVRYEYQFGGETLGGVTKA